MVSQFKTMSRIYRMYWSASFFLNIGFLIEGCEVRISSENYQKSCNNSVFSGDIFVDYSCRISFPPFNTPLRVVWRILAIFPSHSLLIIIQFLGSVAKPFFLVTVVRLHLAWAITVAFLDPNLTCYFLPSILLSSINHRRSFPRYPPTKYSPDYRQLPEKEKRYKNKYIFHFDSYSRNYAAIEINYAAFQHIHTNGHQMRDL